MIIIIKLVMRGIINLNHEFKFHNDKLIYQNLLLGNNF